MQGGAEWHGQADKLIFRQHCQIIMHGLHAIEGVIDATFYTVLISEGTAIGINQAGLPQDVVFATRALVSHFGSGHIHHTTVALCIAHYPVSKKIV